jgi:hypothetical protein
MRATAGGLLHLRLGIHSQGVRNAVDVVELGDHLHRVEDPLLRDPSIPERLQVLGAHRGRGAGELLGELAQRPLRPGKPRRSEIPLDLLRKLVVR